MISSIIEQRRNQRDSYWETLRIITPFQTEDKSLLVISSNISDTGMCIYTFKPLEKGQAIVFKSDLPVPHYKATVKWVKQCDRTIYKVGVLFTE